MPNNFDELLAKAISYCDKHTKDKFANGFEQIYPFTTESISGYLPEFSLRDHFLLTVGSSGDQIINAILCGCKDVTSLDINPYTKFYTYLKLSCLLELDREDFFRFLCYRNYPSVFENNPFVFNKNYFDRVKETLKLLDIDSYRFWVELFNRFPNYIIRSELFSFDENFLEIPHSNLYLSSDIVYQETREKVKQACIHFITGDLFKIDIPGNYDNIWLSNIGAFLSFKDILFMVSKMNQNLSNQGKMLISYLYSTTKDTPYQDEWDDIYDLDTVYSLLKEYQPYLISFPGVIGHRFHDQSIKDSALVYKKK